MQVGRECRATSYRASSRPPDSRATSRHDHTATNPRTALFCAHADVNGDAALDLLRSCQRLLMCARLAALAAAVQLGALAATAQQLAELVMDAKRLDFPVTDESIASQQVMGNCIR
jgi:hypothetical protein